MLQDVLIVGGGKGGVAILKILHEASSMNVVAVIDVDRQAPGVKLAGEWGIAVGDDLLA